MKAEKPFLNSDMKIADLAALTNVSSHKLSYIFSQYMNVSFYDYVNRFRVDEFKRVVAEQGVNSLTLSALAEKAGFSSRASFFRYFKEIEGISPGEYIKNLPR
jgi:transcriptional regulator GlxA family with amidase domain